MITYGHTEVTMSVCTASHGRAVLLWLEREVFKMSQKGGGWCAYPLLNFLSCCDALKVGAKWGRESLAHKHMVALLERATTMCKRSCIDEGVMRKTQRLCVWVNVTKALTAYTSVEGRLHEGAVRNQMGGTTSDNRRRKKPGPEEAARYPGRECHAR